MRINHNLASLNTYRQLSTNSVNGQKSLEKLSSGLRINKAGDDAAGLAISEKMRGQIRGLDQASRNSQDGISMIQTSEGALAETQSILQRMKELATQASNGTNTDSDRGEIQKEMNQLSTEINRIGNTTEFNTQKLLKGKDVAVVETAATKTTVTAGVKGVAVGDISSLTTNAASVVGVASNAKVQASTSAATGTVSDITETTQSIKGVKATVTVPNGITFEAANNGTSLNDKSITILQGATAGAASKMEIDGEGNYTFTIGQTSGGSSLAQTRGALYNELKSAISAYDTATGFSTTNEISVSQPANTGEVVSNLDNTGGSFAGGVAEQKGVYAFTISDKFEEAGDSISIGGQTFTAVLSGADATKGEFNVGSIEATLTSGENVAISTMAGIAATAKVTINMGGTDYTIANGTLAALAGAHTTANLKTAIEGATDSTGALLSAKATVSVSGSKLTITANSPQTSPITWSATSGTAADVALINNNFGMNTNATLTGAGAVATTDNFAGRAAVWNSGAFTAQVATDTGTLAFNGVTITFGAAADNAAAGDQTATTLVTNTSATITYDTDATGANTAIKQVAHVVSAFNAIKAAGGASSALANFTFTDNLNGTFKITSTIANGDASNTAKIDDNGDVIIANNGLDATNVANTAGTDTIDDSAKAVFTIDGNNYTADSQALKASLTGTFTSATALSVIQNAKDSNGHLLSEVADVTDNAGTLTITSKNLQPTSEVTVSYSSDVAADSTRMAALFNIANYSSDTGADAVSSSRTVIDQAKSLAAAIEANAVLGARFQYPSASAGTITLSETNTKATGTVLADPTVAGSGTNDKLVISNTGGQNLNTVSIARAEVQTAASATAVIQSNAQTLTITGTGSTTRANGVKVEVAQNTADDLNVTFKDGVLNISLASTTNTENTKEAIQTAIQGLGEIDGIDFSAWTTSGAGWNAAVTSSDIEIKNATFSGGVSAVTENQLNVTVDNGDLTIHLSAESVRENTATKIQDAVQALGEYSYFDSNNTWTTIDFSKFEFSTEGNWDTATLGNNISKATDTLVGGTEAVKGNYSISIDTAFAAGDKIEIKGKVFTAVASGAVASKGEFNIAGGNKNTQAAGLIDAINLDPTLKNTYIASASGSTITLAENVATGVDITGADLDVRAIGTQGEYSVDMSSVLENGAKFILDGKEIAVSSKFEHSGYSNGTAVKAASTAAGQAKALTDAINTNADLKNKYTASVGADGNLVIKQKEDFASSTAPVVSSKNSSIGNFTSTFQVGANSGQSMTVEVGDMRANALGVTGDGTVTTIKSSNGSTASYVSTANVTDGTTNKNVEFALDVSTHEKATAAIGVLDDAIAAVSAQRSQLGSYQNRLEHTINNLGTSSENLTAAESRIRDVDMAKEMMEFTKNNILSQAAQAMMAQANQQPQGVLQLLR